MKDTELIIKYKRAAENNNKISAYRPLSSETLKSLREYYRIGLTFTSNALEGNSLTESETKVVIEDGLTIEGKPLRDVYEAVGHAKAYDFLTEIADNKTLTTDDILSLHRLFYQQIDSQKAGCFRAVPVFISGSNYAVTPHAKIKSEIERLVIWFNKNEKKLHPVELAAQLHKRFVFIHPFIDGNGRVARLLMNLALLRNGYTIAIIPAVLRHEYISCLEQAHVDDSYFCGFIADCVIATQLDLLRLFSESGGVNLESGGVNLGNGGVNLDEMLLVLISETPGINARAIVSKSGKPLRTVERHLRGLVSDKKIEFRGAAKNGGYYRV